MDWNNKDPKQGWTAPIGGYSTRFYAPGLWASLHSSLPTRTTARVVLSLHADGNQVREEVREVSSSGRWSLAADDLRDLGDRLAAERLAVQVPA